MKFTLYICSITPGSIKEYSLVPRTQLFFLFCIVLLTQLIKETVHKTISYHHCSPLNTGRNKQNKKDFFPVIYYITLLVERA